MTNTAIDNTDEICEVIDDAEFADGDVEEISDSAIEEIDAVDVEEVDDNEEFIEEEVIDGEVEEFDVADDAVEEIDVIESVDSEIQEINEVEISEITASENENINLILPLHFLENPDEFPTFFPAKKFGAGRKTTVRKSGKSKRDEEVELTPEQMRARRRKDIQAKLIIYAVIGFFTLLFVALFVWKMPGLPKIKDYFVVYKSGEKPWPWPWSMFIKNDPLDNWRHEIPAQKDKVITPPSYATDVKPTPTINDVDDYPDADDETPTPTNTTIDDATPTKTDEAYDESDDW